jgi:pteridine reductase
MAKAALITGGGARIGKAIAVALAGMGYDIALHYNTSEKSAKETSDEIRSAGVSCEIFKCDLNVSAEMRSLIPNVFEIFPECSVLVNNASVFEDVSFQDVTEETFDRDMSINFKAPFFIAQEFSRRKSAEIIVNMLDTRVSRIDIDHFIYNLSKKTLREFTLMAARALGPKIRVNGICPGPILPPPGKDAKYLERISKDTPLGRPGKPDYVVSALKYILENPYVTGECLFVDGGEHLL